MLTVFRSSTIAMMGFALLGCDDFFRSQEPDQGEFLDRARQALASCRKTVCDTKFWDNPHCGKAYHLIAIVPFKHSSKSPVVLTDEFRESIRDIRQHLDESYQTSLEIELGLSIMPEANYCSQGLGYRFEALDDVLNEEYAKQVKGT